VVSVVTVNVGNQSVPVNVYSAQVAGGRALVAADLSVDVASRAAKASNLSDLTDPVAALGNLDFDRAATGSVPKAANLNLSSYAIKAWSEFAVTMDGTDKSANLQAAINEAIRSGRELWIDADDEDGVPINTAQTIRPPNNLPYATSFRRGPVIRGVGQGGAVFDSSVANGALFDIAPMDAFSGFKATLGGRLSGIAIRQSGTIANSDGIRIRSAFQYTVEDFHITALSGTGVDVVCTLGDTDGSNQVTFRNGRVENCDKWGLDFEATSPNNEISFITCDNVFAQDCGTDEGLNITAITRANPAVVTVSGTAPADGTLVYLCGIGGMTEVDSFVANTAYTVANRTATTFQLSGINSSSYTAFTSGGRVLPRNPTTGGVKWRGQQLRFINSGSVLCKNVGVWFPGGSGLSQDAWLQNAVVENPDGIGLLIHGLRNGRFDLQHLYSNESFGQKNYAGVLIDGSSSVCRNLTFSQPMVRSTSAETSYTAFKVFGGSADLQSISVLDPDWKQYDFAGQKRFDGIYFPAVPVEGELSVLSSSQVRLRASVRGNRIPLKMAENATTHGGTRSTTGELVAYVIPPSGVNRSATVTTGGAALAINTTFNAYLFDSTQTAGRADIEFVTTAPVEDRTGGRWVKTGDDTRTWVGRVATDGAGAFVTTTLNWLNPNWIAGAWYWTDSTGDLRNKTSLPTSDTDGAVIGLQT
jgi:hypothetical protein